MTSHSGFSPRFLNRRTLLGGAGAGAVVVLATGCGLINGGRGSDQAHELALALTDRDVSGITFDGVSGADAQQQFDRIVANLPGATWSVEVDSLGDISDDGVRPATLSWRWDIPGLDEPWEYQSAVEITSDGAETWTPVWSPAVIEPSLAADEGLRLSSEPAERGNILGASDEVIVAQRPVHQVGLDLGKVSESQREAAARALADLVGVDADAYAATVTQAAGDAFVPAISLREDAYRDLDSAAASGIAGYTVQETTMSLAPTRTFAASTLGRVGEVTQEDIQDSDGELVAGDQIGRGGLQASFNQWLAGTNGVVVSISQLNDDGAPVTGTSRVMLSSDPVAGQDLHITLDKRLQEAAESTLEDVESASAIVAIRPSDGHILALADGAGSQMYPTAAQGQYPPGSTFKVVTSLAMVRLGDTMESTVNCSTSITVDGTRFSNAPGYSPQFIGEIPIKDALAHSCNTAFISQYDRVSHTDLLQAAESLGLGQTYALGINAFSGSMPAEESGVAHAASLFGQGRTLVSPLALAAMTASAVAGSTVTPVLVTDREAFSEGDAESVSESASPSPDAPGPDAPALTADEAEQLRRGMREVVTTGYLQDLQALTPNTAMGKTGTAEFGTDDPPKTHAWIIAAHEDLAISVFVEDGEGGAVTGGPLALEFLEAAQG
ncbi:penicillin-binding transpeptidase domain-containing protein [Kocuria sp.]|uniref:penicillin-binding transpeptidase domain-containing protein n=1 Tax=Kocuria sp. TaxID=1871328 RepID=UPI0026DF8DF1|nr:penicillin-binding transpeptidase domain-containing protein [Kocuria sp.]MDO5618091.1 penicillin-binding transpeptidase domain-containing protein [Kocuria sp.]